MLTYLNYLLYQHQIEEFVPIVDFMQHWNIKLTYQDGTKADSLDYDYELSLQFKILLLQDLRKNVEA